MINRILERLEEELDESGTIDDDYFLGRYIAYKEAISIVKEESYNSEWIPTKEMLFPRYGQKVLATVRTDISTHEVVIITYERQEYWHNGIITAWMPRPEPYTEVK